MTVLVCQVHIHHEIEVVSANHPGTSKTRFGKANAQPYEGKKLSLADFYVVRPGLKELLKDIEGSNDVQVVTS